jgi:hypothetical protein
MREFKVRDSVYFKLKSPYAFIYASGIKYLKTDFPKGLPWYDPYTYDIYPSEDILEIVKDMFYGYPNAYTVLMSIWRDKSSLGKVQARLPLSSDILKDTFIKIVLYIFKRLRAQRRNGKSPCISP